MMGKMVRPAGDCDLLMVAGARGFILQCRGLPVTITKHPDDLLRTVRELQRQGFAVPTRAYGWVFLNRHVYRDQPERLTVKYPPGTEGGWLGWQE